MTLRIKGNDSFSDYPVVFSHEGEFSPAGKFGFGRVQQEQLFQTVKFTPSSAGGYLLEISRLSMRQVIQTIPMRKRPQAMWRTGNLTGSISYSTDLNSSVGTGSCTAVHSVKDSIRY